VAVHFETMPYGAIYGTRQLRGYKVGVNLVTNLHHIININRAEKIAEEDTFTERRYKQFVQYFRNDTRRILDVGCSTGRGGAVMKVLLPNLKVTGLDCVPERIAALDPSIYDAAVCAFTHSIPLANESFDVIVAGEFIEHVPSELVYSTLCEFFRLLRLKGLLLLTTPNPAYIRNKLIGQSVLGGSHVSQHYARNLRRRLKDVGFSCVRIRGSGRVSTVVGERFPIRAVYGSYLAVATKW
jgi:2-polyprenyl-3-methyl-5-hydroxy-6-metoxy-1,4-benzoquinol methylase